MDWDLFPLGESLSEKGMAIKMKKKISTILLFAIMVVLMVTMTACAKKSEKEEKSKTIQIYYITRDDTKIASEDYETDANTLVKQVEEILIRFQTQPENLEYKATIPSTLTLVDCKINEKQVTLNFDETYYSMDPTKEILTRAAIVRTLTQLPDVEFVNMQVNRRPLKDSAGTLVGSMTADMFIDNAGTEINTYEKVKLKLYFANERGDRLIVVPRTVVYSSNISVEKLVVEKLINGPSDETAFPTMNPKTKIISVTTKDGVCYVNLDEGFLLQTTNTTAEVTLYSIINSLVELANVNKVQILINGESDRNYRDNLELSTIYERNLDIVEQE